MIAYFKNLIADDIPKVRLFSMVVKCARSMPIFITLCIGIVIIELLLFAALKKVTGSSFDKTNMIHAFFFLAYTFVSLGMLPLFLNRYLYKLSYRELGLALPKNWLVTAVATSLLLMVVLPIFWYMMQTDAQMQLVYAVPASCSLAMFLTTQLVILPLYYICEEFFFRGFYFMVLWKKIGWHSFWITEVTFMFAHVGKPWVEILVSFPVGILLNFLTLKTKSVYPAIVVHTTIGISVNTFAYL